MVTPAELIAINEEVAAVLRRYRAPARTDPSADAAAVHVVYQAFPRLQA